MSTQACGIGAMVVAAIGFLFPPLAAARCVGDCGRDNKVQVAEIITCVAVALGTAPLTHCGECDVSGDGRVTVDELLAVVRVALGGCCSLEAGEYRLTQRTAGELNVAGFGTWVMPEGGSITLDVDESEAPECRHAVSVPFPGGMELPPFCVGGTHYSIQLSQTGCGVGQIASSARGGYRVTTVADTSDTSPVCNTPASTCSQTVPIDNAARVQVSVADGNALCAADQPVRVLLAIPIRVLFWVENDACGGTFDPGEDHLVGEWPMVLDFTTGIATSSFADLDGDRCAITGSGPALGFARTGTCFDASVRNEGDSTAVVVAAGAAAGGSPIFDMTFALTMPASLTGPIVGPVPTSCPSAPPLAVAGTVDRCFSE